MGGNSLPTVPQPPRVPNKTNDFFIGIGLSFLFLCLAAYSCYRILGGQQEKSLPIPDALAGGEIVSADRVLYMTGSLEQTTKTFKKIGREVVTSRAQEDFRGYYGKLEFSTVSIGTHFKIVGYINNAKYGLSSFDSGTDGINYLVLEDENHIKSLLAHVFFSDFPGYHGEKEYHFILFKNGQRVGFLDYDYGTKQIKIVE